MKAVRTTLLLLCSVLAPVTVSAFQAPGDTGNRSLLYNQEEDTTPPDPGKPPEEAEPDCE